MIDYTKPLIHTPDLERAAQRMVKENNNKITIEYARQQAVETGGQLRVLFNGARPNRDAAAKAGCNILHIITADERLKKLSDKELIIEVLGTPAADYRCVTALMDRLLPNWMNILTDEETQTAKPAAEMSGPLGAPAP